MDAICQSLSPIPPVLDIYQFFRCTSQWINVRGSSRWRSTERSVAGQVSLRRRNNLGGMSGSDCPNAMPQDSANFGDTDVIFRPHSGHVKKGIEGEPSSSLS